MSRKRTVLVRISLAFLGLLVVVGVALLLQDTSETLASIVLLASSIVVVIAVARLANVFR